MADNYKERAFWAFSISASCWLSMLLFGFLDGFFAPMSWSQQWMDTMFVNLVGISFWLGVIMATIGWGIIVKVCILKKPKVAQ